MTKVQAMAMMINTIKTIFIIVVIWALSLNVGNAQITDFRARAGIKLQKDISKKISFSLEYEHRFDNYLTTFDKALIEPSISYDVLKFLRIGAEWRFMVDQDLTRRIGYKQRASCYIRVQKSIDDFDIKIRTALQYGFDELTISSDYRQKLVSRNTIEIEYNWFGSKFKPFTSYEFFYHINNTNGGIINQWRAKAGTSYRLSKKSDLSAYYLYESEINTAYPVNAHVIGIGFSHKL